MKNQTVDVPADVVTPRPFKLHTFTPRPRKLKGVSTELVTNLEKLARVSPSLLFVVEGMVSGIVEPFEADSPSVPVSSAAFTVVRLLPKLLSIHPCLVNQLERVVNIWRTGQGDNTE